MPRCGTLWHVAVLLETIHTRVTLALKRALRRAAKKRGRKLGDHVRMVLEQHVLDEPQETDEEGE